MHTDSERYSRQSVPSVLVRVRLRGPTFRHHLLILLACAYAPSRSPADVLNRLFINDESEQAQADESEEVSSTPRGKRAARGHRGRELRQNPGRARP